MRIQIGTRVKFLNDVGGGIVRGFSQDKYALVETDDGFEVPVLLNELLIDSPTAYDGQKKQDARLTEDIEPKADEAVISYEKKKHLDFRGDAFLAIVPQNDELMHVTSFDLYIVNESNYSFSFNVAFSDGNLFTHIASGTIEADTKEELAEYSQSALGKIRQLRLQGHFFKPGLFDIRPVIDRSSLPEDRNFTNKQHYIENAFFHRKALIFKDMGDVFPASEDDSEHKMESIIMEKEETPGKDTLKSSKKGDAPEEVDLHIHEIVDNHTGMSNAEMIRIQLARFETALETARKAGTKRVVFIHGVGNGRLKHELRKTLDRRYPELPYQDASFREYGFGATMVYLK